MLQIRHAICTLLLIIGGIAGCVSPAPLTSDLATPLALPIDKISAQSIPDVGLPHAPETVNAPASLLDIRVVGAVYSRKTFTTNLYTLNGDGSDLTRITTNEDETFQINSPQWSANGRQIIYTTKAEDQRRQINIIETDGGGQRQLTISETGGIHPAFAPDGQTIAYVSSRPDQGYRIYTMNSDGSNNKRLTSANDSDETYPNWSPDGKQLVFIASDLSRLPEKVFDGHVSVINADGTELRQLTLDESEVFDPKWSPDGQWIVYEVEASWFNLISPDGAQVRKPRSNDYAAFRYPRWSPDSRQLAFTALPSPSSRTVLLVMDVNTLTWREIADDVRYEPFCWLPDSHWLIYNSTAGMTLINDNGAGKQVLTNEAIADDCIAASKSP